MPRPQTHSFIVRQKGSPTYHVRLDIPADVRPAFGGRRVLTASTHTCDIEAAVRVRDELVRSWKAEFAKARRGEAVSTDTDLKRRYQAARATSPIEGDYVRLMTVMHELARAAGLSPEAWARGPAALWLQRRSRAQVGAGRRARRRAQRGRARGEEAVPAPPRSVVVAPRGDDQEGGTSPTRRRGAGASTGHSMTRWRVRPRPLSMSS